VQEATDGGWTLPGGWADVNQSPREGVEREISRGVGYEARAISLPASTTSGARAIESVPNPYTRSFSFCELTGGEARTASRPAPSNFLFARSAAVALIRQDQSGPDSAHVRSLARPGAAGGFPLAAAQAARASLGASPPAAARCRYRSNAKARVRRAILDEG